MPLTDFAVVLHHFESADPKVSKVLSRVNLTEWFEDRGVDSHYEHLTRNIVYQQLAGRAASTIFSRFTTLVSEIKPERVLAHPDQELRDVGLSWAKVKYVKDLAHKVQSGEVTLDNIDTLDDESVITELTKVKGIGRWTAEMFLIFTLHRENVFSFGDLGLKNGFIKLYGIENPTTKQMEKIINKWSPYKSYGAISLWHYLDNR